MITNVDPYLQRRGITPQDSIQDLRDRYARHHHAGGSVVVVTLEYTVTGDLERATRSLRKAYGPREGRIESSSDGSYQAFCITKTPDVRLR